MSSSKYILVTGAYGGMGRATVLELRRQGFLIFALDKNVPEHENDVDIHSIKTDISDEFSVEKAFKEVSKITKELVAIIHFAGMYDMNSLVEVSSSQFRKSFDINVFGAFLVNKTFVSLLHDNSRIIMTTSELAPLDPLPFTGIYAVTKSTLDKYAYSLAMELQLLGIHVSVLRAGAVATNMLGVSTQALENFCSSTELYSCNAEHFRHIVDSVEAKKIPPEKIAKKISRILHSKRPAFAYKINRNPFLLLLNIFPKRLQLFIIRQVLK